MKNVTIGKWLLMVLVLCLICMLPFLANAEMLPSDIEWETAKSLGWIDDTAQPDEPCSKEQFYALMDAMVKQRTDKTCEWFDWQTGDPMQRLYASRVMYEAALNMGYTIGMADNPGSADVNDPGTMMNSNNIWLCGEQWRRVDICPDFEEFSDDFIGSLPWEPNNWRALSSWEFCTFTAKQECFVNGMPVMELAVDGRFRPYDAINMQEAVSAAFRLYCSFGDYTDVKDVYRIAESNLMAAGAVEVKFTSPLLEREVRRQLELAEDEPIYDYMLEKITALSFAGDQLTDVWIENTGKIDCNYTFDMPGVDYNPMVFDIETGRQTFLTGWSFYDLNEFALFPNLEQLTVCAQQVTDIAGIAGLSKLRYLDLSCNCITDLSPLAGLTELRTLRLFRNPITEVTALSKLTSLQNLNIGRTNTVSLSGLENLPLLNLNIDSMPCLTDVSALGQMDSMDFLACHGPRLYDASALTAIPHLNAMEISYLTCSEAEAIGGMNVDTLGIIGYLKDEPIELTLTSCKNLDLWWGFFDNLEWLHSNTVENLGFYGCYTESLNGIGKLSALKSVIMDNTATPDASDLVNCPNIEFAQLSDLAYNTVQQRHEHPFQIQWNHAEVVRDYTNQLNNVEVSANPMPKPIGYTTEAPVYIPMDEVATWQNGVITDAVLALESQSTLPDAGIGVSAHWVGANHEAGWLYSWDTVPESVEYLKYYYEEILVLLKSCGGNAMRYPLNYKWLNNNGPEWTIDSNRLAALDGLLEAAIRNDVHILLTFSDIPLLNGNTAVFPDEVFTSEQWRNNYIRLLQAFSQRYANISNRYLDFELCPEAATGYRPEEQEHQTDVFIELANAIWQAEGSKPREDKRLVSVTFILPNSERTVRLAQNDISFYTHEKGVDCYTGNHTYTVYDASRGDRETYAEEWKDWPLLYVAGDLWSDLTHNTLTFTKESIFPAGTTFELWADLGSRLEVEVDGNRVETLYPYETTEGTFIQSYGTKAPMWKLTLDHDARSVRLVNPDFGTGITTIYTTEITLPGQEPIRMNANFNGKKHFRNLPEDSAEIRIAEDLSCVSYVNGEEKWFDAEHIYHQLWMGDVAIAREYNVNFQVSEIYTYPPANDEVLMKVHKDFYAVMQRHNISSMDKIPFEPLHYQHFSPKSDGVPFLFDELYFHAMFDEYAAPAEKIAEGDFYRILLDTCGEVSLPRGVKLYADHSKKAEVLFETTEPHNGFFIAGAKKAEVDGWIPLVLPGEIVGWLAPDAEKEWISYSE